MRAGTSTSLLPTEVEVLVRSAVTRVRERGSRVVGLIGFSQGTRVVAGLLRATELLSSSNLNSNSDLGYLSDIKFGLFVCPSYPPPLFPASIPADIVMKDKIRMPVFHVLGEQDEWKWAGEALVKQYFELQEGRSESVAWDMGHHYPVRQEESERLAEWVVSAARGRLQG